MSLYLLAEIKKDNGEGLYYDTIGYRIFDNKTMKYLDASIESVREQLSKGVEINGLDYDKEHDIIRIIFGEASWATNGFQTNVIPDTGVKVGWLKSNYWTVVGSSDYAVLAVSARGATRQFSLDYIRNSANKLNFANLDVRSTEAHKNMILFRHKVDTMDIGKPVSEKVQKMKQKMAMMGVDGITIDYNNKIIVTDKELRSVVIPSMCTIISKGTFKNCFKLNSVVIGSGVTSIEAKAFSGCSSLESISIPGNVKIIGSNCFEYCIRLKDIELCEGIKKLRGGIFRDCRSLSHVVLPSTLEGTIDLDNIFMGLDNNVTVEIPFKLKDNVRKPKNPHIVIKFK